MKIEQPLIHPPARWPTPKPEVHDAISRFCLGLPPPPPPPPLLSLPPPLSPRALDSEPMESMELLVPAQGPVELLAVTDQFAATIESRLTPNQATAYGFAAFGAFIDAPVCAY